MAKGISKHGVAVDRVSADGVGTLGVRNTLQMMPVLKGGEEIVLVLMDCV